MSFTRAFLEAAGCALVISDDQRRVISANRRAELLFGVESDQLVGSELSLLFQFPDADPPACPMGSHVAVALRPNGTCFPTRIISRPLNSPQTNGTLHTLEDLSAQRAAEREAWEMEQNLNEILSNTPVVVYVKNLDWQYDYVNTRFLELFHLTLDTVIGKTDFEIFPIAMAQAFRDNDVAVKESGLAMQLEEVAPHDDGPHDYLSMKFPLRDKLGNVRAVAGISTDVTESRKSRVLEQELQAAALVQRQLYPKQTQDFPGYEIAGIARPARIASGDYYDFIPHGPDKLCVVVGDVSGHGLAAAVYMVETRAILRAFLEDHMDLSVVVERLNRFLFRDTPEQQFVTFFIGEIDADAQTLTYVAAGHPAWILDTQGNRISLEVNHIPLGLMDSIEFHSVRRPLHSGEMLFVASDGIPEVHSAEKRMFGWKNSLQVVRDHRDLPATEILARLLRSVENFKRGEQHLTTASNMANRPADETVHFEDDLTAVLVKCGTRSVGE